MCWLQDLYGQIHFTFWFTFVQGVHTKWNQPYLNFWHSHSHLIVTNLTCIHIILQKLCTWQYILSACIRYLTTQMCYCIIHQKALQNCFHLRWKTVNQNLTMDYTWGNGYWDGFHSSGVWHYVTEWLVPNIWRQHGYIKRLRSLHDAYPRRMEASHFSAAKAYNFT